MFMEPTVRFQITMNMPSRSGNSVHQIIGEHPATTLEDFVHELHVKDFVIVEEFYRRAESRVYDSHGMIAINHLFVGKIKPFMD